VHQAIGTYAHKVAKYIALTEFSRNKFVEAGLPDEKLTVKPNFVYPDPGVGDGRGGFVLYVGRLSPEKGIETLLQAWEGFTDLPLKIIGSGPLQEQCRQAAARSDAIEYLGALPSETVYRYLGSAVALVVPSLWYEGFPRVIVEAYAKGTPVIASRLGSLESLITHERTGLHFAPGDPAALRQQIERLTCDARPMRAYARAEYEQQYSVQRNYETLLDIYNDVLTKRATHVRREAQIASSV
jgi:glycosyltransferase involved in cell wall biosynthesis